MIEAPDRAAPEPDLGAGASRGVSGALDAELIARPPGRYLRQYDVFRTVTFIGVVGQHAILWPITGPSVAGWGLVLLLHFTRNAFFFLSAFVASYAQSTRPRPIVGLWRRRLGQIAVPYFAWTLIYFVHTLIVTPMSFAQSIRALGGDVDAGYKQLYYLVVLAQLYVLLPALVWLVRRTRGHHGALVGGSFALQLVMTTIFRYVNAPSGWERELHGVASVMLSSRLVLAYQLYVVAGLVAAAHVDALQSFVDRHSRRILCSVVVVGLFTEGFYLVSASVGHDPGTSAGLNQPVTVVWFLAAIAGLVTLGRVWDRSPRSGSRSRLGRLVVWSSDASGGFYLAHVLVLELILEALTASGVRSQMSWAGTGWILFFGTLAGTGLLVGALMRTPLRFVLTGPDRKNQRERLFRPNDTGSAGYGCTVLGVASTTGIAAASGNSGGQGRERAWT